jgi:hypothetical protein
MNIRVEKRSNSTGTCSFNETNDLPRVVVGLYFERCIAHLPLEYDLDSGLVAWAPEALHRAWLWRGNSAAAQRRLDHTIANLLVARVLYDYLFIIVS